MSIEQLKSKVSVRGPRLAVKRPDTHPLRFGSTAVVLKFTFW
jgi:hypothetical protein